MLLVWKGNQSGRRWRIGGRLVGVSDLRGALKRHWDAISHCSCRTCWRSSADMSSTGIPMESVMRRDSAGDLPVIKGNYIFDSPKPLKAMQPLFVHHPAPTGKNNGSNARRLSIHVLTSAPSTSHRLRLAFSCRSAVTVNADPGTSMLARAWVRCTLMAFFASALSDSWTCRLPSRGGSRVHVA